MTRINTNVSSLVGRNNLANANANLSQSLTRLSTGLRINTGKDDPAGLIASENLRSDITSIERAIGNTDRANQVIATADSALGQVSSLLNDIRGLVTESANSGALSDEQIAANQLQVDSSLEALNRIAQTTTFQGRRLLDGSLDFQTTAGTNSTNISNLQIDQANLGATGSVAVDVDVTTAATQATVTVEGIDTDTATTAATGSVDFSVAATSASGELEIAAVADAASGTATFGNGSFDIDATTAGAAGNTVLDTITIVDSAVGTDALAGGTATLNFDISTDGDPTLQQVANALNALTGVDVDNTINGTQTVAAGSTSVTLSGGADAAATGETISVTTAATGAAVDVDVTIDDTGANGAAPAVAVDGSGNLTVNFAADAGTISFADLATLINDTTEFNATTTSTRSFNSQGTLPGALTLDNGVDAATGTIEITTTSGADSVDVSFATASGITTPSVSGSVADGFVVTIDDTATTSLASIAAALQANSEIATATSTDPTAGINGGTDTLPAAFQLKGDAGGVGLSDAVVFELSGAGGSEVLSFGVGTTVDELVAGINLVADATGVSATNNSNVLELTSSGFGSNAAVDVSIISEGTGSTPAGVFTTDLGEGERAVGDDIVAAINGVVATGDGNNLSINTATLDLSATLTAGFTGTASFTVTGGGAKFQLGPDVVSNQQARLGIGSVNTARLGGLDGKLFQLGSGGSFDLSSDPTTAAAIVESAIDQVTSLRGRLGAFQRTSLETNRNALNDTLTNLTEAESSIRDADFAAETANLTRSQILVQSGTRVLAIANQNPQNVLSLLQ